MLSEKQRGVLRGIAAGAPARALGFALTFYPSALMLLTILAFLLFQR
jgi:hypothetical protein